MINNGRTPLQITQAKRLTSKCYRSSFGLERYTPSGSKQTQIISGAMNDTMDPDGMLFNGVKNKVVLNNEEPISYRGQFFFIGDLAHQGIDGEVG